MVKYNLLKDLKNYKNGFHSSFFICYYLSFLPLIVSFLYCFFSLFQLTHFRFLYQHLQYSYLLILFPVLFLLFDITRVYLGKYKLRFSLRTFIKDYPETLCLFACLVWILLTCIFRLIIGSNITGFETNTSIFSLEQGFPFYLFYAMCFVFAFMLKSRKITENIILSFIICSTILVIFSLIDPTGKLGFQAIGNTNWCSVFFNSNYYGYYLCLTTILCFATYMLRKSRGVKYCTLASGILHLFVCFMNNSLACMLSVFIVLIIAPILFSINSHKLDWHYILPIVSFVAISQLSLIFAKNYYSNYENFFSQLGNMFLELFGLLKNPSSPLNFNFGTGRVELWSNSIKNILECPIFGSGNTRSLPHSEYLQLGETWGLPCLTFYLATIIIILIKSIKYLKVLSRLSLILLTCVLSYLISACFGCIMPHITPYFIMLLAFFVRWSNVDIKKHKLQKQIQTEGIEITDNNVL